MKVMFISNLMMMGGVENNIVLLTREFTSRGHRVLVVSSGGNLIQELHSNGGESYRIDIPATNLFSSLIKLRRLIHRWKPDIIHVFSAYGNFYLWLAYSMFNNIKERPPIISSVMGLHNSPKELLLIIQLRNFLMTLGVNKILIISPEIHKYLRRLPISEKRLIEKKVVGIRIPEILIDSEKLEVRKELGVREEEKIVITVGALVPRKSHELFIDAAFKVLKDRIDIHFFIVGEGHQHNYLANKIETLGIQGNVHLLGLRKDVLRLLAVSDVCVKPGIVEGFVGINVMEAQSLGVPVVAFETTDVKLVIDAGITGLIVPKSDTEELAKSIKLLLTNKVLASKIGEAGRNFIQTNYSVSIVAKDLLSLYEDEIKLNYQ